MEDEPTVDLKKERELAAAIKQLPQQTESSRDLWPEIAARLPKQDTKVYTPRWIPWSIAATLAISFSSAFYSWKNLQTAQRVYADSQRVLSAKQVIPLQIKAMELEYGLAKSALITQIGLNSSHTNSDLLSEVKSHLLIIEQATKELKAAIVKQPDNPGLPKLLKATYQQELTVLSQLAKLNQDVFSEEKI
ncbi:hypothetical protein [Aliikangiella coralliicola]|uniref:Uncharacterized protein n=1 Tax=Aliikangiella coralliicola TaxID=2592383 RepID=A0A545TW80_9GAMM|nr:hypothetical protein [Aliikangiella coralliicola]TQV81462.1 hypothetical protein FLL46_25255 [Aliikangiella coralliicola]